MRSILFEKKVKNSAKFHALTNFKSKENKAKKPEGHLFQNTDRLSSFSREESAKVLYQV